MLGGIGYGNGMFQAYNNYAQGSIQGANTFARGVDGNVASGGLDKTEGMSEAQIRQLKRSGAIECEACKNRKYQDGSDEADVSFKSPGHISPAASGALVRAHEQQHVANAYEKAGKDSGKVISASVKIDTAVCPECGRSYVSGGVTNTMIKYNESTPYGKAAKSADAAKMIGRNIDYAI